MVARTLLSVALYVHYLSYLFSKGVETFCNSPQSHIYYVPRVNRPMQLSPPVCAEINYAWSPTYISIYSRTPLIRFNWDDEPSGYAENSDNWDFIWITHIAGWGKCITRGTYYLFKKPWSKDQCVSNHENLAFQATSSLLLLLYSLLLFEVCPLIREKLLLQ